MSIDRTIQLRDGTRVKLLGEDKFRARATIQGGKGEPSDYLLVGTIGSSKDEGLWMSVLFEIELHANSTAHEARLLHFFVDWILVQASSRGMQDEGSAPWIEYHWRSFNLTKLS